METANYLMNTCPTEVTKDVYTLFQVLNDGTKQVIAESADKAEIDKEIDNRKFFIAALQMDVTLELSKTTIGSFTGFIEDEETWVVS